MQYALVVHGQFDMAERDTLGRRGICRSLWVVLFLPDPIVQDNELHKSLKLEMKNIP